jgi:SAM-dependent methyltransferase
MSELAAGTPRGERDARADAYEGDRPEVRALVPPAARRVLDLGCAGGALGAGVKRRGPGIEVVGVELDPAYAAAAAGRLDRVVEGDVAAVVASPGDLGRFDCIVAADVLEHLVDPWEVVRRVALLLEPGGTLVVSLPNVRFWETFWQLGVRGTWPRRPSGVFDGTHLRWFALRDARELVEQAGLRVVEVRRKIWILPRASRLDRAFGWLARTPLAPFFTAQHLLVAELPAPPRA